MEEHPTKFNIGLRNRGVFYSVGLTDTRLREQINTPLYYYDNFEDADIITDDDTAVYSSIDADGYGMIRIGDMRLDIDQLASEYIQTLMTNGTDINVSANSEFQLQTGGVELLIDAIAMVVIGFTFVKVLIWMITKLIKCSDRRRLASRYTKDDTQCTICLDDVEYGTRAITLECDHVFHAHCITQWLDTARRCPNCNQTTSI